MRLSLNELRTAARYTQQHLGDDVGVCQETICRIERGDRIPNVVVALRIASILGVAAEDIDWTPGWEYDDHRLWPKEW